jgi:hypothetical protein
MTASRIAMPVALAILVMAPASAGAALTARTSIQTKSGVTRIAVTLSSPTRLSAASRPRAVSVRIGSRSYKLTRAGARAAAVSLGTWRSAGYRGTAAKRLVAAQGKSVKIKVTTRRGTRTISAKIAAAPVAPTPPTAPAPAPAPPAPGAQPLFAKPPAEQTGQPAFDGFKRYFLDSRFTDCPPGWPACAVEERYNHCPDGSWEYHRLTPTSGSDINAYGSYQVTGAAYHVDGSWAVEYVVTTSAQSFYSWRVAADGTVTGGYWAPGSAPPPAPPSQQLGPLRWQQPARCGQ